MDPQPRRRALTADRPRCPLCHWRPVLPRHTRCSFCLKQARADKIREDAARVVAQREARAALMEPVPPGQPKRTITVRGEEFDVVWDGT